MGAGQLLWQGLTYEMPIDGTQDFTHCLLPDNSYLAQTVPETEKLK